MNMKRTVLFCVLVGGVVTVVCSLLLISAAIAEIKSNVHKVEANQFAIMITEGCSENERQLNSSRSSAMAISVQESQTSGRLMRSTDFETIYKNEGGTKAYMQNNNRMWKASNPRNIGYLVTQISGNYLIAAKYAFSRISAVSNGIFVYASTKGAYSGKTA